MKEKQINSRVAGIFVFAIVLATILFSWQFGLFEGGSLASASRSAYATESATLASEATSVTVVKSGVQAGTAVMDKGAYATDDTVYLKWKGAKSGNNLVVPVSVEFNSTKYSISQLVDVSKAQAVNTEYKRLMNQTATMTDYDTLVTYLLSEHSVSLGKKGVGTQVKVEFATVAPVYRLYNKITSEHLFSTSKSEYDKFVDLCKNNKDFWIGEGIDWLAPTTTTGTMTVHRLYNAGLGKLGRSSHYYTANTTEMNNLIKYNGWKDDGASYRFQSGGTAAIYTCYNENLGSAHHYTANKSEWEGLAKHGWDLEKSKNGTSGVFQCLMGSNYTSGISTSSSYAAYTVIHQQEGTDGKYTTVEKQVKTGKIGSNTVATANSYTGFTAGTVTQAKIANDGKTTVTIKYSRNLCTVTFEGVGTEISVPADVAKYGAKIPQPETPTAIGYTFEGWYWDSACTKPVDFNSATMPNGTTILYGKMTGSSYTVSFYANGHGTAPDAQKVAPGDTAKEETLTAQGWVFGGWYTDQACSDTKKWNFSDPVNTDLILYAKWTAGEVTYTVNHFKQNVDGSFPDDPALTEQADGLTGQQSDAQAKTAQDEGWEGFTNQTINNVPLADDGSSVVNIYYVREAYPVTFDLGKFTDAFIQPSVPSEDVVYGGLVPSRTVSYAGYHLMEDAEWTYTDGQETIGWTFDSDTMPAAPLTLTANWQPNTDTKYTVKHILADLSGNYGTDGSSTIEEVCEGTTAQDTDVKAKTAAEDSRFAGFVQDDTKTIRNVPIDREGKTVVEVYYKRTDTTVTYNAGEGITAPDEATVPFGSTLAAPDTTSTVKQGYKIEGWYTDSNYDADSKWTFEGDTESTPSTVPADELTLYAKWVANTYRINFDAGETSGDVVIAGKMTPQTIEYDSGATLKANAFSRNGYSFNGWKWNTDGTNYIEDLSDYLEYLGEGKYTIKQDFTDFDDDDVQLEPKWIANTYKIKIRSDEEAAEIEWTEATYDATDDDAAKLPTEDEAIEVGITKPTGMYLSGWKLDDSHIFKPGESVKNLATGEESNDSAVLVAVWEPITYYVNYNANNGTGAMERQVFTYGVEQAPSDNEFTRVGYTFAGWDTDANADADDVTYKPGTDSWNVKTPLSSTQGDVVDLYAIWKANTYTVIFNQGSGVGTPKTQTVTYDESTVLDSFSTTGFECEGYHFDKWALVNNSGEVTDTYFKDGDSVINLADGEDQKSVTLEAQWASDTYTIKFSNGGDDAVAGFMNSMTVSYEDFVSKDSVVLDANTFTKTGYHFDTWYLTGSDPKTFYSDEEPINKIIDPSVYSDGDEITLEVTWEGNAYKVGFNAGHDGDGSTPAMEAQEFVYGDAAKALSTNTYTRAGYTFKEWKDDEGRTYADKQAVFNLATEADVELELIAQWEPNTYKVHFDTNVEEGVTVEGTMADQAFKFEVAQKLDQVAYLRHGWTFKGWSTDKDATPDSDALIKDRVEFTINDLKQLSNDTLTLYAIWEQNGPYTVDFNVNGKSDTTPTSDATKRAGDTVEEPEALTPNDAGKGQHIEGWYTDNTTFANKWVFGEGGTQMPDENVTLYAKWVYNNYTVKYAANDASVSGTIEDQKFVYETEGLLSTNEHGFIKPGHHFLGWSTDKKATTADSTYPSDGTTKVKNLTDEEDGVVTLYPVWKVNTYTINFVAGDHSDETVDAYSQENVEFGTKTALDDVSFKPATGYLFDGWQLLDDDDNVVKTFADKEQVLNLTTVNDGEVTLTAAWKEITYIVRYDGNSEDSGSVADETHSYNDEFKFLSGDDKKFGYVKTGYHLAGWTHEATEYDPATMENVKQLCDTDGEVYEVSAKWEANTYDIVFDIASTDGTTDVDKADRTVEATYDATTDLSTYTELAEKSAAESGYGFAKTGYHISGWKLSDTVSFAFNETVKNLTTESEGEVTLTAVWEPNTYYVDFKRDLVEGAENPEVVGAMERQTLTYGTSTALSDNKLTRAGYVFKGWKMDGDTSSTKVYEDKEAVSTLTAERDGVVVMRPVWEADTYTITYNSNYIVKDGDTENVDYTPDGVEYAYDTAKALTTYDADTFGFNAKQTGYTFDGWNTKSDGNGISFADGAEVSKLTTDDNITLYAVWKANTYTVNFASWYAGDGTESEPLAIGSVESQTFTYGVAQDLNANTFKKTGYTASSDYPWNLIYTDANGDVQKEKQTGKNFIVNADLLAKLGEAVEESKEFTLYSLWDENEWNFTFKKADKTNMGDNYTIERKYGEIVAANIVPSVTVDAGYHIEGWYVKGTGEKWIFGDGGSTMPDHAVVVEANVVPNNYRVRFAVNQIDDANDPDVVGSMEDQVFSYEDSTKKLNANTFTKPGYHFLGWSESETATAKTYDNEQVISTPLSIEDYSNNGTKETGVVTLYPVWKVNTYTITFNAGEITTGTPASTTTMTSVENVEWGAEVTLPAPTFELSDADAKVGWKFSHWTTENSVQNPAKTFNNKEVVKNLAGRDSDNDTIELIAVWAQDDTFFVSYNANGGTGFMQNQVFKNGEAQNLLANSYQKSGYHFAGWSTTDTGDVAYADQASYTKSDATFGQIVTLYAKWEANTYNVAYYAADADEAAKYTTSTALTYDTSEIDFSIPATGFDNLADYAGKHIVGWTYAGNTYKVGQTGVKNLTTENNATVKLVAKWEANTYTIVYSRGTDENVSGEMTSQVASVGTYPTLKACGFSKTGWTFSKWYSNGTYYGAGTQLSGDLTTVDGATVTLTPSWQQNTYSIVYNSNYGDGSTEATATDENISYAADVTLKTEATSNFAKTGHHIGSWNTIAGGGGKAYELGDTVKSLSATNNDTFNLFAQWEANTYTVHFDNSDAEVSGEMDDQKFTYGVAQALSTNTLTKTGYTFAGWTGTKGSTTADTTTYPIDGTTVSNLTATNNGVVTLYPVWTANTYDIEFNSGTIEVEAEATPITFTGNMTTFSGVEWGASEKLTKCAFTPSDESYEFDHWSVSGEGTDTTLTLTDEATVKNLTATDQSTVTLTANWKKKTETVTVTFAAGNGGSGEMQPQIFKVGEAQNLRKNEFVKAGSHFNGWAGSNGTSYTTDGGSVTFSESDGSAVTLTAAWDENKYTVNYDKGDADSGNTLSGKKFAYAEEIDLSSITTTVLSTTYQWKKAGHELSGWKFTDANGTERTVATDAKISGLRPCDTDTESVTITAVWSPITYTVNFAAGGAEEGEMATLYKTYGDTQTSPEITYHHYGYLFIGFSIDGSNTPLASPSLAIDLKSATKVEASALDAVLATLSAGTKTITLTACWESLGDYWLATAGSDNPERDVYVYGEEKLKAEKVNQYLQYLKEGNTFVIPYVLDLLSKAQGSYSLYTRYGTSTGLGADDYVEFGIAAVATVANTPLSNGSLVTFKATHTLLTAQQMDSGSETEWENTELKSSISNGLSGIAGLASDVTVNSKSIGNIWVQSSTEVATFGANATTTRSGSVPLGITSGESWYRDAGEAVGTFKTNGTMGEKLASGKCGVVPCFAICATTASNSASEVDETSTDEIKVPQQVDAAPEPVNCDKESTTDETDDIKVPQRTDAAPEPVNCDKKKTNDTSSDEEVSSSSSGGGGGGNSSADSDVATDEQD